MRLGFNICIDAVCGLFTDFMRLLSFEMKGFETSHVLGSDDRELVI